MGTSVGLWIDHKRTVLATVTGEGGEIGTAISRVESQLQHDGDSPHKGHHESQRVPADDIRQRVLTGHLNTYYEAVIACLRDAESILLLGPGEAKGELKKRMERDGMGARIAGVETADKMTDRQIAAKVRQYFAEHRSASGSGQTQASDDSGQAPHRTTVLGRKSPGA